MKEKSLRRCSPSSLADGRWMSMRRMTVSRWSGTPGRRLPLHLVAAMPATPPRTVRARRATAGRDTSPIGAPVHPIRGCLPSAIGNLITSCLPSTSHRNLPPLSAPHPTSLQGVAARPPNRPLLSPYARPPGTSWRIQRMKLVSGWWYLLWFSFLLQIIHTIILCKTMLQGIPWSDSDTVLLRCAFYDK